MKRKLFLIIGILCLCLAFFTLNVEAISDLSYDEITWSNWDDATSLPINGGNYKLNSDVFLDSTYLVSKKIRIDLNGHTIVGPDNSSIISIKSGSLSIYDGLTGDNGGKIISNKNSISTFKWIDVSLSAAVSQYNYGSLYIEGGNLIFNDIGSTSGFLGLIVGINGKNNVHINNGKIQFNIAETITTNTQPRFQCIQYAEVTGGVIELNNNSTITFYYSSYVLGNSVLSGGEIIFNNPKGNQQIYPKNAVVVDTKITGGRIYTENFCAVSLLSSRIGIGASSYYEPLYNCEIYAKRMKYNGVAPYVVYSSSPVPIKDVVIKIDGASSGSARGVLYSKDGTSDRPLISNTIIEFIGESNKNYGDCISTEKNINLGENVNFINGQINLINNAKVYLDNNIEYKETIIATSGNSSSEIQVSVGGGIKVDFFKANYSLYKIINKNGNLWKVDKDYKQNFEVVFNTNYSDNMLFNISNPIIFESINVLEGEVIENFDSYYIPSIPQNYSFEGWYNNDKKWDSTNIINKNIELVAVWKPKDDCPIKIKTYIQKSNYDEINDYEDPTIENKLDGVFGEEYKLKPKEIEGYFINNEKSNLKIDFVNLEDNIIEIYYDRELIDVKYKDSYTNNVITKSVRYNSKLNEPEIGIKQGFIFEGWFNLDTNEIWNFESCVIKEITLYSKWKLDPDEKPNSFIVDNLGNPITYAKVTIKQGNNIALNRYKETYTDSNGKYSLKGLEDGYYNLIVEYSDIIITSMIRIEKDSEDREVQTIDNKEASSVLSVNEGTKDVVVGGLDTLNKTDLYTDEDRQVIEDGGKVVFHMNVKNVEMKNVPQQLIDKIEKSNKIGAKFMNMDIEKVYVNSEAQVTMRSIISELPQLLEIRIPLSQEQKNREGYIVYRLHNGNVLEITETPNENGSYLTIENEYIVIKASKFSTYCLVYDESKVIKKYDVRIDLNNGTIPLVYKIEEDTKIVKPEVPKKDGYTFDKWVIKGTETEFDFNIPIKENLEIVAVYIKNQSSGENSGGSGSSSGGSSSGINRPFIDIKRTDWYYEDVYKAYDKGLIDGIDKKTFNPNGNMDRASTAHIFYVLNKVKDYKYKDVFNDVIKDTKYMKDILWVNDNNIMIGYGHPWLGSFGPQDSLTREQFALILYRVYKKDTDKYNWSEEMIEESKKVSDWALESMCWAVSKNIIKGNENGDLMPQKAISRAEACTIIIRLLKE